MEEENKIVTRETNTIKLNSGMKGQYGWEIKIVGDDEKDIMKRIKETDAELTKTYRQI